MVEGLHVCVCVRKKETVLICVVAADIFSWRWFGV